MVKGQRKLTKVSRLQRGTVVVQVAAENAVEAVEVNKLMREGKVPARVHIPGRGGSIPPPASNRVPPYAAENFVLIGEQNGPR